ncbi:hypothetical protein [Jejuia pallidilutea]|nr:hypothetical protein [Jejuia pallidilutea]GAL89494.1 hypothetical protein JCM19538_1731 [Jejuia pallidilutea]
MIASEANGEIFHRAYTNAQFLEQLLDNGTYEDIKLAEKIIPGLLSTQELRKESPHYGGFRWEVETPLVDDLNAVEFVLDALIPAMIRNQHKLSSDKREQLIHSIRLGLKNIAKINVSNTYTNIILKDISNTSLGGELLNDSIIANRGYKRMKEWMEFTDDSGTAYEYNSLPYMAVALDVLSKLEKQVKHKPTQLRAKLMLARLSLASGLHLHASTNRWAGPHGRAYHNSYISEGGWYKLEEQELKTIEKWIQDGTVPFWIEELLTEKALPNTVKETTSRSEEIMISTSLTKNYTFGVATRNMFNQSNRFIDWQSNVFCSNFVRPNHEIPGVFYTRYILDDKWLGDFSAGPGRPYDMLIPDMGHFQGVQDANRAIGVYIPRNLNALEHHSSAKSVIALPRWDNNFDEIWVDDKKVTTFPFQFQQGQTVVVSSGNVYFAVRPFTISNLSTNPQLFIKELNDKDHTLTIEMYNYSGPQKTFWELAYPGTFYQGQPQNGFYSEMANKTDYKSPSDFAKTINSGTFEDVCDPKKTYTGTETRKWLLEYKREGRALGIEVDLFDWFQPTKRWTDKGEITLPMLESKWAIEDRSGDISIQNVQLKTKENEVSWMYVSPSKETIVAAYHGFEDSALRLVFPDKSSVAFPNIEAGILIWHKGILEYNVLGNDQNPIVINKGALNKIIQN